MVASSPICKSSVVDLVDLVMSGDHQNENSVWLCRVTKKKVKQKRARNRAHLNQIESLFKYSKRKIIVRQHLKRLKAY